MGDGRTCLTAVVGEHRTQFEQSRRLDLRDAAWTEAQPRRDILGFPPPKISSSTMNSLDLRAPSARILYTSGALDSSAPAAISSARTSPEGSRSGVNFGESIALYMATMPSNVLSLPKAQAPGLTVIGLVSP